MKPLLLLVFSLPFCAAGTFRDRLEEWKSTSAEICSQDPYLQAGRVDGCWHLSNLKEDETLFNEWLRNFKAANPVHHEYCLKIINEIVESPSQAGHDMILFFNLFWRWAARNVTGIYAESGAASAIFLSNSFFYDACLGWKGLCIEPQEMYFEELLSKRSCQLVPMCLSDSSRQSSMILNGSNGYLQPDADGQYTCASLQDILEDSGMGGNVVDLWSLDVEGHEERALDGAGDLTRLGVLLVEDEWIDDVQRLDRRLNEAGMVKLLTMWGDSVWVGPRLRHLLPAGRPWLPTRWQFWWNEHQEWVKLNATRQLRKDHHSSARDSGWDAPA